MYVRIVFCVSRVLVVWLDIKKCVINVFDTKRWTISCLKPTTCVNIIIVITAVLLPSVFALRRDTDLFVPGAHPDDFFGGGGR